MAYFGEIKKAFDKSNPVELVAQNKIMSELFSDNQSYDECFSFCINKHWIIGSQGLPTQITPEGKKAITAYENENTPYLKDLSERNIITHAIKHFQKKSSPDYITRIFSKERNLKHRTYIDSVLKTCTLFQYKEGSMYNEFKLTPETTKAIFTKNIEMFVDEYLKYNKDSNSEKSEIKKNQSFSENVAIDLSNESIKNMHNTNSQKSVWRKTWVSIKPHIVTIIVALIIAYLVFIFKWN